MEEIEEDDEESWSRRFITAARRVYEITKRINLTELDLGVIIIAQEEIEIYMRDNILNLSLAKTIYLWAEGKDFAEIMTFN